VVGRNAKRVTAKTRDLPPVATKDDDVLFHLALSPPIDVCGFPHELGPAANSVGGAHEQPVGGNRARRQTSKQQPPECFSPFSYCYEATSIDLRQGKETRKCSTNQEME
jgi:hypothetical protein